MAITPGEDQNDQPKKRTRRPRIGEIPTEEQFVKINEINDPTGQAYESPLQQPLEENVGTNQSFPNGLESEETNQGGIEFGQPYSNPDFQDPATNPTGPTIVDDDPATSTEVVEGEGEPDWEGKQTLSKPQCKAVADNIVNLHPQLIEPALVAMTQAKFPKVNSQGLIEVVERLAIMKNRLEPTYAKMNEKSKGAFSYIKTDDYDEKLNLRNAIAVYLYQSKTVVDPKTALLIAVGGFVVRLGFTAYPIIMENRALRKDILTSVNSLIQDIRSGHVQINQPQANTPTSSGPNRTPDEPEFIETEELGVNND